MAKTLTILLNRGPYISESADLALRMAIRAREKGHNVNLYLYVDGVWAPHLKSDLPHENVGKLLREALEKGVDVKSCARCAEARDATDIIEGIPLVGLFDLMHWVQASDKVVTFTS